MNWLEEQRCKNPDKTYINGFTFLEVAKKVKEIVNKVSVYVDKEKRVAIYGRNSFDTALFFLAFQCMGKEVFMLNVRLSEVERKTQLENLGIMKVFSVDATYIPFSEVNNSHWEVDVQWLPFDENQIAIIMNTSATTGSAKSVPIRWSQIQAHVMASKEALGCTPEDTWLMVLPMFHVGGMMILLRSLYNGTACVIMDNYEENVVVELIESNKINMLSVVPTMLTPVVDRLKCHNLRVVLIGGEEIPLPLVEKCLVKDIPVYKTYGMTESCSQVTTFCVNNHPEKVTSVGRSLKSITIGIDQPDMDGVGEIVVCGSMVMKGYIGLPPIDNVLKSGDLGKMDDDGYLYVSGRVDHMIISGGENIQPKEIENLLYELPSIKACAVLGKQDDKWGQVPVLFVVTDLGRSEIQTYLKARLSAFKQPKEIIRLSEMPQSATGKVDYQQLKRLLM